MATVRLQLRRGTASQWTSSNPILAAGEMGVETDTRKVKIGDGTTSWTSLDYVAADSPEISEIAQDAINDALVAGTGITKSYDDNANTITVSVDTSVIATKAELAEVSQDSVNDAIVAGVGLDKVYDDNANTITLDIDSTVATLTGTQTLTNKTLTSPVINGATVGGDLIPTTDNAHDLGSSSKMWRDIYVGPGSLYVNGQKVLEDDSGNIVVRADADENLSLRTSGSGNIELDPTGTGSVLVKGSLLVEAGSNITGADGNAINFGGAIKTDTISSKTANTDLSLSGDGTGKVYLNDNAEVSGNLVVSGNLTINGTATNLNAETLSIADNLIDLNSDVISGAPSENAGIRIKRGDSPDVQIRWNESTDKWEVTSDGATYSSIAGEEATAAALSSHTSDTTDIHGIADTANLVTLDGSQLLSNKTISNPFITGNVVLEGTTDNDYELTLDTNPTADRTITFPDNSGTVALVSNLSSYAELSGATFTGAVSGTDLTLSGNLTVNGTTTNLNTTNLNIEDKNITLGDTTSPTDATADGGGFSLKGSTDKTFNWVDATDSWTSSENMNLLDGKTYKINGNIVLSDSQVLGKSVPSGTIVGNSDSQTLTNKTINLANNTISATLAELNSAVSNADLVSLTGAETLTNKTLTSPAISSPTGILKGDVELGNVDNTSDLNKPVSTATQTALDLKANLASPTFTGTVTLPNTTAIGDVTSTEIATLDGVTSNIQTQLNAKLESTTAASTYAPIASPTFTGTVSGVTKNMVGLANVDNTADTAKPVSSATQTALDLKANLASPTFTGTVTLPNGTVSSAAINWQVYAAEANLPSASDNHGMFAHVHATGGGYYAHDGSWIRILDTATAASTYATPANVATAKAEAIADATAAAVADATAQVNAVIASAPAALNTLDELAAALGDDASFATTVTNSLAAKAPLASPTFTGTVTVAAEGVAFTDATQTKAGVPSITTIGTEISADYNLSTGGLGLRDQLIPIAGTRAITVPANSTTAYLVGTSIDFYQASGTGANFEAASGVTILGTPGLTLRTTYSSATLTKVATDTWLLAGDLTA